jgi:DNA helicase-2/ATP-dependent DNA helicase PcrA
MQLRLTKSQERVVNHGEGALLVVAGPGSGKTRVLTERIKRLVSEDDEHFRVLGLTFTNKAANEMLDRLEGVPGVLERAFLGTMHSFCTEVLANRGKTVGVEGTHGAWQTYT